MRAIEDFKIFTFPLLQGDPDSVLSAPSSIVLTERTARKYFGDKDPLGRVIQVDEQHEFQVTGVLKNLPNNSHIQFDFAVPFSALKKYGWEMNEWGRYGIHTHVLLNEHTDYRQFNTQIKDYLKKYDEETLMTLSLQPFKKIRLYSRGISAPGTPGDIRYITVFSLIAFFILLMACFNFMNLATARSERRARESSENVGFGQRKPGKNGPGIPF